MSVSSTGICVDLRADLCTLSPRYHEHLSKPQRKYLHVDWLDHVKALQQKKIDEMGAWNVLPLFAKILLVTTVTWRLRFFCFRSTTARTGAVRSSRDSLFFALLTEWRIVSVVE